MILHIVKCLNQINNGHKDILRKNIEKYDLLCCLFNYTQKNSIDFLRISITVGGADLSPFPQTHGITQSIHKCCCLQNWTLDKSVAVSITFN